jgi:membrane protease YdiL (CAAX protease family)
MPQEGFSHLIFWQNPIQSICFFAFAMSFISLWIRKTPWLWGSFLTIAYILAFSCHIVTWLSLLPILILLFCHYNLKGDITQKARFLYFGTALLISSALCFHFLPGFHNWEIANNLMVGTGARPFNLWLNFDKPFIALFPLAFTIPLISSRFELFRVLKTSIPMTLLGIFILMGISLHFNLIQWDPKIPSIIFVWLLNNLIFVCISEEAFFRGFIQKELYTRLGQNALAAFAAICITSLFFALFHLIWVADLPFLCLVFTAGLIYGTIYQVTQSIEASILCHFGVNAIHFLFFTYPAL